MIANTFGIHQSTVSKLMLKVSQSITEISWPKISQSAQKSKRNHKKKFLKLEVKFDMTQALGVIDGTLSNTENTETHGKEYKRVFQTLKSISTTKVLTRYQYKYFLIFQVFPWILLVARLISTQSFLKN